MKTIRKYSNIRKFFSSFSKKYNIILTPYNYILRKLYGKSFREEIERRRTLSIFDYEELIKPIPYCPIEKIKDSNYYGYVNAIKHYVDNLNIVVSLEHGLYLDDQVSFYANYKTFDSICTLSDYRIQILHNHGVKKKLLAIGPYIHYAQSLLSDIEVKDLKSTLGKVLLYMPSHSTNRTDETSNYFKEELDIVDKMKCDYHFDTILVCIYYLDFRYEDCIKEYVSRGYKLVTAGHQLDTNFIRRLKSIIMLSDYTVSNTIGTNLGFCIYLGKPHLIINDYKDKYNKERSGFAARREIADAFANYSPVITDKQREVCNKYWGFESVKSADELREFLMS